MLSLEGQRCAGLGAVSHVIDHSLGKYLRLLDLLFLHCRDRRLMVQCLLWDMVILQPRVALERLL